MLAMPRLTLDHVIIAAEDLGTASVEMERLLGRRPSWHGRHPSYGTANVLFRLENAYLELLAPDPQATTDSAWTGSLGRFLKARGPGLFSIALQTADVFEATARAREQGLPVEDPLPGTGEDYETHAVRAWVNARIPPESTRGTRAFFITHTSPASALPEAPPAGEASAAVDAIGAVVAASTDTRGARRMWREVFEMSESKEPGGWRYDLGNATLLLRQETQPGDTTDWWDSLVLKTPDLSAARTRLSRQGFSAAPGFSPFRGIALEACGTKVLITEAK
jgi:hypothetical protein